MSDSSLLSITKKKAQRTTRNTRSGVRDKWWDPLQHTEVRVSAVNLQWNFLLKTEPGSPSQDLALIGPCSVFIAVTDTERNNIKEERQKRCSMHGSKEKDKKGAEAGSFPWQARGLVLPASPCLSRSPLTPQIALSVGHPASTQECVCVCVGGRGGHISTIAFPLGLTYGSLKRSCPGYEVMGNHLCAGMVIHVCNLDIQEAEADGSGVLVQPGLHGDIIAQIWISKQ